MNDSNIKEIITELNNAWFNINIDNKFIINPLDRLNADDPEEFYKALACLLMNPDYFYFICKHILNIELLPIQALILKEMWNRKFPMLVGSRGLGKTFILSLYCMLRALLFPGRKIVVVGAAFRQSKYLHDYMETIWKNAPVLKDMCDSSSGPRRDVDLCKMTLNGSTIFALPIGDGCLSNNMMITYGNNIGYTNSYHFDKNLQTNYINRLVYGNENFNNSKESYYNGQKELFRLKTKRGYTLECTENHKIKILRDKNIQWIELKNILPTDSILIDRTKRWHSGTAELSEDDGYFCGLMIGDGSWTNKYKLQFTSKDIESINFVKTLYPKLVTYDNIHYFVHSKDLVSNFVTKFNLREKCYTKNKSIPNTILSASKDIVKACLQGLFDTDGTVQVSEHKGGFGISIKFSNTSQTLVEQIHFLLLHFGIISTLSARKRNVKWNTSYELNISGQDVKIFAENIGFRLSRKQDKLLQGLNNQTKIHSTDTISNITNYLKPLLSKYNLTSKYRFNKNLSRKQLIELYSLLSKQEDLEWLNQLLNPNIFYDSIYSIESIGIHDCYDLCVDNIHEYCANGFFVHNSKIRGQRANDIICDEFASMSREIFENVIAGFAAVSATPVENVKRIAFEKKAHELGLDITKLNRDVQRNITKSDNQIILSGTAFYGFNHFADYWRRWKTIIESKGDPKILSSQVFNGEDVPSSFNWKDYSVLRIPVELIPEGFMDEGQIARSKATVHNGIYLMEFGAVFTKDSQGFFKRSLIESCVATDRNVQLNGNAICFDPILKGVSSKRYIMAIDPASEVDNFSIVILELNENHRRIVYCWTTTRKEHIERVQRGLTSLNNFYSYCARKIRDLMGLFPIVHISIDSQGGGYSISEALHDSSQLLPNEIPIWPIINEDKPQPSDDEKGLHILELCQFANYLWYSEANHGLRKDFEDKILLFPRFDPITIGLSIEEDKVNNRIYDTLEDCIMDIEELKNELALIEISQSANGREKWDTPEVKIGVGKKRRMRKDRYSALLMANMAARNNIFQQIQSSYIGYGGFAAFDSKNKSLESATFSGPSWFTDKMNGLY